MQRYGIDADICGDSYRRLLEYFANRTATYLFAVTNEEIITGACRLIIDELKLFGAITYYDNKWPGTTLLYGGKSLLIKGDLTPAVFQFIKEQRNTLFSWKCPDSPEDLCLIDVEGNALLASTSHECFATVLLADEDLSIWRQDELLKTIDLRSLE